MSTIFFSCIRISRSQICITTDYMRYVKSRGHTALIDVYTEIELRLHSYINLGLF